MNLADAIRQARRPDDFTAPALIPGPPEGSLAAQARAAESKPVEAARLELIPNEAPVDPATQPHSLAVGGVVRLEMSLSPEQLTNFFRSVLGTQHSVMTAREAATLLRVNLATIEKMAEERVIPALQIDGKWRFPRTGLEEWLAVEAAQGNQEATK